MSRNGKSDPRCAQLISRVQRRRDELTKLARMRIFANFRVPGDALRTAKCRQGKRK